LRAKARVARWVEEKEIVSKEMEWTLNSFAYHQDQWKARIDNNPDQPGFQAYAEKQLDLWNTFAQYGTEMFHWAKETAKKDRWRKLGPETLSHGCL
jgi:cyclopropane fatty-acyl-phospholipid synthase-like methyltransferase